MWLAPQTSCELRACAVAWVTSVPSASLGDVIVRLGERLAAELGVPYVTLVSRTEDRPPQREMANAVQQAANVRGAFAIIATPPPGTGVLLDDRRHSGWTLAMVGGQLRRAGAQRVVPLALGTLTVATSRARLAHSSASTLDNRACMRRRSGLPLRPRG